MKNTSITAETEMNSDVKYCTKCIYSNLVGPISFDEDGICNYCKQIDEMKELYGTGSSKGKELLENLIEEIKLAGKGKKYDCLVGVSGGTDSSYLLMKAVDWGLRPLAVHYDNTWNNACSTQNISKITSVLNVDLWTYVIDNKEADDLYYATFLAGIPEWDASSDIAFVQVLRSTAAKFGIKYILEGHSFQAEGISPVSNNYFDGKYISGIHKRFGRRSMSTFPNLTFIRFLKWVMLYNQKFLRPLWYLKYSKEMAREELTRRTDWTYYGGHHLENRAAVFGHTVYLPQKFGIDYRYLSLAAAVRSGVMDRSKALKEYDAPLGDCSEIIEYVKKRLKLSDEKYNQVMSEEPKSWIDYPTYKKKFELLRPLFFILAKANLVPMSFYLKYCFPIRSQE